jgi:hypothetical protein
MVADYLSCSQMFYGMQFVEAPYCVWTQAMGYWWLLILVVLGLAAIAEKTKNGWTTGISSLVLMGGLYNLLPIAAHGVIYFVTVMGFATTMYAIFRGRDNV